MRFIVKVSSESFIKSRSVRSWHITQLRRNIARILSPIDIKAQVRAHWDRLEVDCAADKIEACRQRMGDVPGIHSILSVDSCTLPEEKPLDYLAQQAVSRYADKLQGKSFAVRCRRAGQHDFRSLDVERHTGTALLENSVDSRVKLKQPDITVNIEILRERAYFVREKVKGLGGYPLGTQGAALSLVSGGFDSSVASFQMMRRGCRLHYLFFNLGGTAHSLGVQQAAYYLWQKFGSTHSARFYSVSLDRFVADLMQLPDPTYNGVLLKRAMLRIGDVVANRLRLSAMVTGESLAQVSSQTLHNLSVIDQGADHLVLRPLITTDKSDIIATAEKIGSAIFAQNMVEYCGVISKKPTVAAPLQTIQKLEEAIGDEWFQQALDSTGNILVADIINHVNEKPQVELIRELSGQQLIDIRATNKPLDQANQHIPFFKLNQQFPTLPQDKEYLLYCDKGVTSQLHAAYLHEQGFENVKVYRPE